MQTPTAPPLAEAVIALLQARAPAAGPLLDAKTGRALQAGVERAVGGHVSDWSDYQAGRAYRLRLALPASARDRWRYVLRLRISTLGPYATQTFQRCWNQQRWWSAAIMSNRNGWEPEHAELLERLRDWYRENGLQEVDAQTQAVLLPAGVPVPGLEQSGVDLFTALFGG